MACVQLQIPSYDTMCEIGFMRVFLRPNRIKHLACAKVLKEADRPDVNF